MQGIIIENISNLYKIKSIEGNIIYESVARGKFKKQEITPVVGDLVQIEVTDEANKKAVINKILDRKVYIKRPKLANITQLVFVVSSKEPNPDLLMLDKQIAFAEFLKVKTLIVLSKADLDKNNELLKLKEIYENIGYTVIETSSKNKLGIDTLIASLKNNINAFSGNSGVGKSTLINEIFNEKITLEGEISQKNKRGKNTTTSVKLYEIDKNSYVADTPGFSTFDISEIESKELDKYFIEFKSFIKNCEFIGCSHIKEEKCGIKEAVKIGKISKDRYDRFCKIFQEIKQKEEYKKW